MSSVSIKPLFFYPDGTPRIYGDEFVEECLSLLDLQGKVPVIEYDAPQFVYTGQLAAPDSKSYWIEIDEGDALTRPRDAKKAGIL